MSKRQARTGGSEGDMATGGGLTSEDEKEDKFERKRAVKVEMVQRKKMQTGSNKFNGGDGGATLGWKAPTPLPHVIRQHQCNPESSKTSTPTHKHQLHGTVHRPVVLFPIFKNSKPCFYSSLRNRPPSAGGWNCFRSSPL